MLLGSFYKIKEHSASTVGRRSILSTQIVIDKTHPIFQGHFPNMPVVPGVCMIQIIKEIFQSHLRLPVFMTDAANIKFLSVINPEINNELSVEISFEENAGAFEANAKLYFEEITFFKVKCILSTIV